MKILLGKIGQKIIFNRESKDCDRSNTNGNVGTYLLFKLLIENNKDITFYVASENDLGSFETFESAPYANVIDASGMEWYELKKENIDVMLVLTGLTQYEKNDRFINIINNLRAEFMLLSDDPRCLDSVSEDERITRMPNLIISQFEGEYNFKGKMYHVFYEPIERASCYKFEPREGEKDFDMVIVSNTSGEKYNRVKIVSGLIDGMTGLSIYGRLSEDEKESLGRGNCKGEVKYAEMQKILSRSYSTLVVPIQKGWVTSKYVESLMNGVLPIFYKDYNTELLEAEDLIVVRDSEEFSDVLENLVKKDKKKVKELVAKWYKMLIEPYVSGQKLSNILINYACGAFRYTEGELTIWKM